MLASKYISILSKPKVDYLEKIYDQGFPLQYQFWLRSFNLIFEI